MKQQVWTNTEDQVLGGRSEHLPIHARWRQIRQGTGLEWVTPDTFRQTVATLIAERVDSETAPQQLGHSSPAITRKFYIAKPAFAADVAHVLQTLAEPVERPRDANSSGFLP